MLNPDDLEGQRAVMCHEGYKLNIYLSVGRGTFLCLIFYKYGVIRKLMIFARGESKIPTEPHFHDGPEHHLLSSLQCWFRSLGDRRTKTLAAAGAGPRLLPFPPPLLSREMEPPTDAISSLEIKLGEPDAGTEESKAAVSKKAAKKEAAKAEKLRRQQEAAAAAAAAAAADEVDPLAANYGDVPLVELQSKAVSGRTWTPIGQLEAELKDQRVLVRGRLHTSRAVSKNMSFVVLREKGYTVQCILSVKADLVSKQMVKFASGLSRESIVDVEGVITVPENPITGATQQVRFHINILLPCWLEILL